ncbi:MAG: hypothetical protein ACOX8H_07050 [Ruminococcus sp.]
MEEFYNRFMAGDGGNFSNILLHGFLYDLLPDWLYTTDGAAPDVDNWVVIGLVGAVIMVIISAVVFGFLQALEEKRRTEGIALRGTISANVLMVLMVGFQNILLISYVMLLLVGCILYAIAGRNK